MTRYALQLLMLCSLMLSSTAHAWEPVAGPRERAPRWSGPMIYRVNEMGSDDLDIEALTAELHKGLLEWTTPACTGASARYDGLTPDLPPSSAGALGADNVIAWRESGWLDGLQTVAVTAPSFIATDSGAQIIVAATMRLNGQHWTWVHGRSSGRQINLFSVLLHEGGHYWGLGHSLASDSVMVESYSTDLTGLAPDDSDGICTLYPLPKPKECTCPSGYACTDGNCLWEGRMAAPVCKHDSDCSAASHCKDGLCAERSDRCAADRDCESSGERCIGGGCMLIVDPPAPMCTSSSECTADQRCKAGVCVTLDLAEPDGLAVGGDCKMDSDCQSGLCRFANGTTQCTSFCTTDAECGADQHCLRGSKQTGLCGASEHKSAAEHAAGEATGCSSTRSASTDAWGWFLLCAWLLRPRWRG